MTYFKNFPNNFYWPDFVIYNSEQFYRGETYPNFAYYSSNERRSMPFRVVLNKQQAIKWFNENHD